MRSALETKGEAGLPVVKVNGEIKSSGVYPSRAELSREWAGVSWSGSDEAGAHSDHAEGDGWRLLRTGSESADDERTSTKSGSCC